MNKYHHTYVVPGIVDGAVVAAQAEHRRDKKGEATIVHAHKYEDNVPCNEQCRIFEPGYMTRSIKEKRTLIDG